MTFSGTSLSNLAGVFGRTFSAQRGMAIKDKEFDIYERAPVMRDDIEAMLAMEIDSDGKVAVKEDKLRASEKLEHDTMCMIRGALYPAD